MEGPSRQGGSKPSGLHRRDLDQNQPGAAAWLGSPPQAAHRPCAAWPHWKTMTFLAALRRDWIDAPWVLDGPINGEAFKTYVRNELLKTLKPGDIVVLDNLGSHKGKAVRNMIRHAGAHLMFLPPYSPDLNPIEQVFAKIKHLMRRAMERTVEAAQDRLVSVLDTIPPNECANYFSGAG